MKSSNKYVIDQFDCRLVNNTPIIISYSFNERGACNVLACLTDEQKKFGVITASTGNHALAMCYHAMRNNIPCCVVMPASASPLKMEKCRELSGNKVVIHGEDIAEAKQHALDLALEKKMVYING